MLQKILEVGLGHLGRESPGHLECGLERGCEPWVAVSFGRRLLAPWEGQGLMRAEEAL